MWLLALQLDSWECSLMLRVARLHFVIALVIAGCAVSPAPALAVAPTNDGYLQSLGIPLAEGEPIMDRQNTREATVQADLFAPPRSGGGAERTDCLGTSFGATVWYDFLPRFDGTMSVAGSGFDTVAGVYEFDRNTERIGSRLACDVAKELFVKVKGGRGYTIQVGGVDAGAGAGPATGDLTFKFEYFVNRDGDEFLDALDDCDTTPGTLNGCPATLSVLPTLRATPTGRGIQIRSLVVDAPRGARVKVRCQRGCAFSQTRTALTSRPLSFPRLTRRQLPAGARLEIFVTKSKSIGSYTRYTVTRGNFKRIRRCLKPGSLVPRTSCK
jgi:hypothetical protein